MNSSRTTMPSTIQPIISKSPRSIRGAEHRAGYSASLEGRNARNRPAHDQRMDVVRPFIGIDGFEVGRVAHHLKLGGNAVPAVHVASNARDIQGLAAIVALDEANGFRDQFSGLQPPAHA